MVSLKELQEGELLGPGSWKTVGGFLNNSLSLLWLTCLVWYVGYVFFYAPSHDLDEKELETVQVAQVSVETELSLHIRHADILLKPLKGKNLDIYLAKFNFESIPYPVREGFVNLVGKSWCDQVEHIFMPSVKIKDIASGETLGEYDCFKIMNVLWNQLPASPTKPLGPLDDPQDKALDKD